MAFILRLLLAALVAGMAAAQDDEVDATQYGTTVVYDIEYFERYDIITAVDMLQRIPGVSAILNAAASTDDARGFGSGGDQILINGRRLAGKASELVPALERVQAAHVRRIELIRGTSADIDVRSEGVLVNIVLQRGVDVGAAISWSLGGAYLLGDRLEPVGSLSYGGEIGRLTFLLGAEASQRLLSRQRRDHLLFRPDGERFQVFDELRDENKQERNVSANLIYDVGAGRELRINALLVHASDITDEPRDRYDVVADDDTVFSSTLSRRENDSRRGWEVGGDYAHSLGQHGRLTALFVVTDTDRDVGQLRRVINPVGERLLSREQTDERWTEHIVRGSYQHNIGIDHAVEFGVERAFNQLTTDFQLFVEENGVEVEFEIFNSDSIVEEVRWEVFATHNWSITPAWSLESSLTTEFSRIEQRGDDVGTSRSFTYLKPRLDLRHDLTTTDQIRWRIERTISQLDFANFVASFDFESERLRGGNPTLVPQRAWETQGAYERRLSNDAGVFEARIFYNRIDDYIDRILIPGTGAAQGNLGRATWYGVEAKASLRMEPLGLSDAVLSFSYRRDRTRVRDPLTAEQRLFSGLADYQWRVDFRHDLSRWPISYGTEISRLGPRTTYEIPWFRHFDSKPELKAFVQARVGRGMTFRIEGSMLLWDEAERDQRFFATHRGEDILTRTEYMFRRATPQITATLRGRL